MCYQGKSLSDLLPDGIITDILTRLPAKPLARFKCVSKNWNSHISTPNFLKSYTSGSPPSSWAILDRVPKLVDESTKYVTQFNLLDPPNVSTPSINPHKLAVEPVTDPNQSKYPSVILQSSNGLLLFTLSIKRDPQEEHRKNPNFFLWAFDEDSLYVVNPVTNEWVPLPKPIQPINKTGVAFTTKLDPVTGLVDKFLVVEYQPIVGSNVAIMRCFSSDVGKWVEKSANYMLGSRFWRGEESFEFEGRLFWVDLSAGLITWDQNDPFAGLDREKEAAVCRFIPVPSGCVKPYNTPGLQNERCMDVGGGFIQYMELFKEGNCLLKLWRLKNCEAGEWGLMYNVSRDYVERNLACEFEKGMPRPWFFHPFEADVAYFEKGDYLFSLNVRTREVEGRVGFIGHEYILPVVLPKWPSPLPKRLYAAYAKEEGNECFKSQNFGEAIKCYSKSIGLSPNAAAFANRAMSYLKVNKLFEAENDCTESLKLDANYFKVYWRRALARKELGFLTGALEDVEIGLTLEPDNEDVKKLRVELKSMLVKESCDESEFDQNEAACDVDVEGK